MSSTVDCVVGLDLGSTTTKAVILDEEGEIWDSAGTLVAQSRQLSLMPRA